MRQQIIANNPNEMLVMVLYQLADSHNPFSKGFTGLTPSLLRLVLGSVLPNGIIREPTSRETNVETNGKA